MELRLDNNILVNDWEINTSGSTDWFIETNLNSINSRGLFTDPFGNQSIIWQAGPGTSDSITGNRAGWSQINTVGKYYPIDNTKMYRYSFWINRLQISESSDNNIFYFGPHSFNSSFSVIGLTNVMTGNPDTNPYFIMARNTATDQLPENTWRLAVGYVYPYDWTGNTLHSEAGIWTLEGYRYYQGIANMISFAQHKWRQESAYAGIRYYQYNTPKDHISLTSFPRIDVVDGYEPSIEQLLSGNIYKVNLNSNWYDVQSIKIKNDSWVDVKNIKIKKDTNLLDYSDWNQPITGSTEDFIAYSFSGGRNYIIQDIDPFGNNAYVWLGDCTGLTLARSGWNSNPTTSIKKDVDITKTYRLSVWVKQKQILSTGAFYAGAYAFSSDSDTLLELEYISTGVAGTTRYFAVTLNSNLSTYLPLNEWILVIGYIHPYTHTGTISTSNTGFNSSTGVNITKSNGDLRFMNNGTSRINFRIMAPYAETGDGQFELVYPRIDVVDGTEPSITTLLTSEGVWLDAKTFNKNEGDWST